MASVGTYGLKTLNDNWFEDRHQPADALSATAGFEKRAARAYETDIAYIGERYDVLNRIARMPPRESYATPDDGFREKDRTSSVDFAPPRSRKEFVFDPPAKPALISTESVPEVSFEERRPIPGNNRGFGAVLNRHEESEGQRFWSTTSGDFYGEGARVFPHRSDAYCHGRGAGTYTGDEEAKIEGVKVGCLTGENFCKSTDPACDTNTQRAWLYQADPALKFVHLGGTRPRPGRIDNELSLPIGDGAMAKVRKDLAERKGRLYRTATTITKGLGQRSGHNLFQDG
jgi:hypothetical protein